VEEGKKCKLFRVKIVEGGSFIPRVIEINLFSTFQSLPRK
jgi:hypothetical protein